LPSKRFVVVVVSSCRLNVGYITAFDYIDPADPRKLISNAFILITITYTCLTGILSYEFYYYLLLESGDKSKIIIKYYTILYYIIINYYAIYINSNDFARKILVRCRLVLYNNLLILCIVKSWRIVILTPQSPRNSAVFIGRSLYDSTHELTETQ